MKYTVRGMEVGKDGVIDLPDDVNALNVFYHPVTGKLMLGVLEEYIEDTDTKDDSGGKGKESSKEK